MRLCRTYIQDNSNIWKSEEEERAKKTAEEEKKRERLRRAAEKKETSKERETQRKLTDTWKRIPQNERRKVECEESRARKLEMREIKENIWKKWRGRDRNGLTEVEKREKEVKRKEELQRKLDKLEEILESVRREDAERQKKKE